MSDPFDPDDESPDEQSESKANAAFAQQRKELAALKKEAEELRVFKAQREQLDREDTIGSVFTEVGLNPKHAKLYAALNPEGEANAESVAQFAAEYGLVTAEGEPVSAPAAPEPQKGFVPTAIPQGQSLGSKMYSHEEFMDLLQKDPDKAMQIHQAGRVELYRSPQTHFVGRDK